MEDTNGILKPDPLSDGFINATSGWIQQMGRIRGVVRVGERLKPFFKDQWNDMQFLF